MDTFVDDNEFYGLDQAIEDYGDPIFDSEGKLRSKPKVINHVIIPKEIKVIEDSTFSEYKVNNVTLPDGLEDIYDEAFKETGVTSLNLPSSVKMIGREAFAVCRLEDITIPKGAILRSMAFGTNDSLKHVTLFDTDIETLPKDVFLGCHNIEEITVVRTTKAEVDCSRLSDLSISPIDKGCKAKIKYISLEEFEKNKKGKTL